MFHKLYQIFNQNTNVLTQKLDKVTDHHPNCVMKNAALFKINDLVVKKKIKKKERQNKKIKIPKVFG